MPTARVSGSYVDSLDHISDCYPRIEFSIPGSGIEKFVIPGSRFGIRLIDWSLFWYPQMSYFMHRMYGIGSYEKYSNCKE